MKAQIKQTNLRTIPISIKYRNKTPLSPDFLGYEFSHAVLFSNQVIEVERRSN